MDDALPDFRMRDTLDSSTPPQPDPPRRAGERFLQILSRSRPDQSDMTDGADADAEQESDRDHGSQREGDTATPDESNDFGRGEAESGPGDESSAGGAAPDELIARVAAVDEAAAAEVEAIRRRVAELEADLEAAEATIEDRGATIAGQEATIEELESKVKRTRADFQNYKKRVKKREEELRARATEDLVKRLLDVRDNLVRAVEQDDDVEVRDGVEATLATFDRVLDAENLSAIEPESGQDVEPERHEVVHRTESDEPEGAIVEVFRPGYEMAGKVIRPAQVTVSEGESAADDADSAQPDDD